MIRSDGETYYWMRITATLSHWDEDDSVRMMVYRQNIDEEKNVSFTCTTACRRIP